MRQKGSAILLVIFIVIVLGIIGYLKYSNLLTTQLSSVNTKVESNSKVDLIGIWQANGSMASGWADRYHFYSNGKYHFYHSEMMCDSTSEEQKGNWKLQEGEITIKVISTKRGCDGTKELTPLAQPYERIHNLVDLGTLPNDFYPSILFEGKQYWKFSSDPTSYGDEKFPSE